MHMLKQQPRLMLVALIMSVVVTALLVAAISFEFFVEEMAKMFVVPMLVAATFTSIIITGMLARSSTS